MLTDLLERCVYRVDSGLLVRLMFLALNFLDLVPTLSSLSYFSLELIY